jgi:hypothetical protein
MRMMPEKGTLSRYEAIPFQRSRSPDDTAKPTKGEPENGTKLTNKISWFRVFRA